MIAANEWAANQEEYSRYGFDTKQATAKNKGITTRKRTVQFSAREKTIMLIMIAIIGVCCIAGIFIQAGASTIKYNINNIQKEIDATNAEIEDINVLLKGQNSIDYIEEYAKNELGLVYPTQDQYIYVSEVTPEVEQFIADMKASQKGVTVDEQQSIASLGQGLLTGKVLVKN